MPLPRLILLASLGLMLAGCEEEQVAQDTGPVIRSIKHMTLDQRAGLQERRIAGVVTAAVSTNVAFEINGQVIELLRSAGDQVEEGELIARLDPEPARLRMTQSENSLAQAQASFDDAQKKFEQQRRLRQQGFATQTAFDTAQATLRNAEGAVGVAQSSLDLAKRDLAKSDLKAPFAGVIGRRDVEVFQEVSGGQTIYAIQSDDEDKIEASLPETLINTVSLGSEVEVSFPPLGGASVKGIVDEIAPLAGEANAYPIEVKLEATPPGLRSGMSAELVFRFATEDTGKAFVIPMAALLPDPTDGEARIFVFMPDGGDAQQGTLAERKVRVLNIENNQLQIVGELQEGDVIATAGVSFLHDGMTVTLFDQDMMN